MSRITRKRAKALGRKQFNSATPCPRCGTLKRYTSTGNCIKCQKAKQKERHERIAPKAIREKIKEILSNQLYMCEVCQENRLTLHSVLEQGLYNEGQREVICRDCLDNGEKPFMDGE